MKQARITRPVRRLTPDRHDDREGQDLLPLTAREFLKLSVVPRLQKVAVRRDSERR